MNFFSLFIMVKGGVKLLRNEETQLAEYLMLLRDEEVSTFNYVAINMTRYCASSMRGHRKTMVRYYSFSKIGFYVERITKTCRIYNLLCSKA